MTRVGLCESCFDEGSCCCNEHCYCLIGTLYYSAMPTEVFEYASTVGVGKQFTQVFTQTDDRGQAIANAGSVFVSNSWLDLGGDRIAVQRDWVFTRKTSAISAGTSFERTTAAQPDVITYAATGGLGRYKQAKKLIVSYRATTNIYVVKVYA